jgi:spermidine synthase
MRDRALILSVLIVASCGLGYELISSALASYLLGDSILQILLGDRLLPVRDGHRLVGLALRRGRGRARPVSFELELMIGMLGGASAAILFVIFAWCPRRSAPRCT